METIKSCVKETALILKDAMYLESHYQNVLVHLLMQKGFVVSKEICVPYRLPNGFVFGSGRIDIALETEREIFLLELKVHAKITQTIGQIKRYMIHYPNPSRKVVKGGVISFNHANQSTTKFLTLKPLAISSD